MRPPSYLKLKQVLTRTSSRSNKPIFAQNHGMARNASSVSPVMHFSGLQQQLGTRSFHSTRDGSLVGWKNLRNSYKKNPEIFIEGFGILFVTCIGIGVVYKYPYELYMMLTGFQGPPLDPSDPKCIRVGVITRDLIKALHADDDDNFSVTVNGSQVTGQGKKGRNAIKTSSNNAAAPPFKEGDTVGKWEVTVIDSWRNKALWFPGGDGGKILVWGGGAHNYENKDEEIAFKIGHQVGRALTNHIITDEFMYYLSKVLFLYANVSSLWHIYHLVYAYLLFGCYNPFPLGLYLLAMPTSLTIDWHSRRRVLEADHTGLMLLASAGYDPRKVAKEFTQRYSHRSIVSSTPANATRAKHMHEAMEEAMTLYNKATSDKI